MKHVRTTGFRRTLIFFIQDSEFAKPAVGSLYDPPFWEDHEAAQIVRALDDLYDQSRLLLHDIDNLSSIRGISPYSRERGILSMCFSQNGDRSVTILGRCGGDDYHEEETQDVDKKVSLSTVHLFSPRRSPLGHRRRCTSRFDCQESPLSVPPAGLPLCGRAVGADREWHQALRSLSIAGSI
jgi:hypothetical protein